MEAASHLPPPKTILDPKEQLEMRIRLAERAHDVEGIFGQNANAAAVKAGEEAIKAAILINGGSSVAMLAFIGTLASKDVLSPTQLAEISKPLLWFGTGVAAGVIASAAAYFTNLMIAGSSTRKARYYDEPFMRDTPSSKRHWLAGEVFRYLGVIAAAMSIGSFVCGLVAAENAFQSVATAKVRNIAP